jgi:hypothetical protein
MRRQPRTVSWLSPAFAYRFALEPGDSPHDMHRRSSEQVLEGRARHAAVATLAQRKAPDALREAPCHARPHRLGGCELGRLLTLSRSLERGVVGVGADGALAWRLFGCGAYGTEGTGATGGPVTAKLQHRIAGDIVP